LVNVEIKKLLIQNILKVLNLIGMLSHHSLKLNSTIDL